MKVIFLKSISKNNIDDIKDVADGYAQNFLIPNGFALPATAANINNVKNQKNKREKEAVLGLLKAEKLAEQIEGKEIILKEKASEKGTLFASISEKEMCQALKIQHNIIIDPKHLKLNKHIKEVGEHEVIVGLNHGLEAKIKIKVESL